MKITLMKMVYTLLVSLALLWGLPVSAHGTLIDRGGGMIYDTDLNITWLQDANYANTTGYDDALYGFDTYGMMFWVDAMTWANNLVYGGYDDWRLPTVLNHDGSGPCWGINCTESEMGHLYYTELGNTALSLPISITPFFNVQQGIYWSSTEYVPNPWYAWGFNFYGGIQATDLKFLDEGFFALAVRDGDVVPAPEPGTLLLVVTGCLMGLVVYRKRFGFGQRQG